MSNMQIATDALSMVIPAPPYRRKLFDISKQKLISFINLKIDK